MSPSRPRAHTVTAAAALAVTTALAGCSSGPPEDGDPAGRSGSSYELNVMTPAPTAEIDSVTWNVFQGEPWTLDPFKSADYGPNMINSNMCETLLQQTPEFEIKPNLAASFSNPDPLTWVYELRDDVTFWDGSPMTSDDVAATMNHSLTDPTSFQNYLYADVASITATGPREVTVKLSRPNYLFNDQLASYAGVVMQKKYIEAHAKDLGTPSGGLMCTGPFQFESWKQGDSVTLKRYDRYWNKDLMPKTKELKFTFLTDGTAITSALLSGDIDGTYQTPVAANNQLRQSDEGTLSFGPAPLVVTLFYANPKGAMADPAIRKALQEAIDWQGIGRTAFGDVGGPAPLQTPKAAYGFAADALATVDTMYATTGKPDLAAAEKSLEAASADALAKEITMVVPEQAETQQLGVAVKDAADKLGLKFKVKVVPANQYTNYLFDPATRGSTDILYTTFWPNVPNPLDWMQVTAVSGGSFNHFDYTGVDDLFREAVGTADAAERATLAAEMETKLREDLAPMTPGINQDNTVWQNKRITGAPAAFDYTFYPWAAHIGGTGE